MEPGPPASPVQLKIGESFVFRLKGRGSAGFQWNCATEEGADAIAVTTERASAPALPPAGGPPPSNFSTDTIVTIAGRRAGTGRVRVSLARAGSAPVEEHVVEVRVL